MPSQQKTLCQACGALVPTELMPQHVRRNHLDDHERIARAITTLNVVMGSDVAPVEHSYLERGDAIAELLDAVCSGATLEIQGPTATNPSVRAWIENPGGSRVAHAKGEALGPVLVELARQWKRASTVPAPPPIPR